MTRKEIKKHGIIAGDYLITPFKNEYTDKMDIARLFFRLIAAYTNIILTESEVEFLAYVQLHDGVATSCKAGFCDTHDMTIGAVDSIVTRLKKKKILVKTNGCTMMNPKLIYDFSKTKFIFNFKCILTQQKN